MYTYSFNSILGKINCYSDGVSLTGVYLENQKKPSTLIRNNTDRQNMSIFRTVQDQIISYFKLEAKVFRLPIYLNGTTFQQRVWNTLQTIPYGTTVSYSQIARAINRPKSYRAVGMAISQNPISIIIPCHRVIAKTGNISGYAGGLDVKKKLLRLEKGHMI